MFTQNPQRALLLPDLLLSLAHSLHTRHSSRRSGSFSPAPSAGGTYLCEASAYVPPLALLGSERAGSPLQRVKLIGPFLQERLNFLLSAQRLAELRTHAVEAPRRNLDTQQR